MKIILFVLFLSKFILADYNLFVMSSTDNRLLLSNFSVNLSDYNSYSEVDNHFLNSSSNYNHSIFRIGTSDSDWSADAVEKTKDSQVLIYLSEVDYVTSTNKIRVLGFCVNTKKAKYSSSYMSGNYRNEEDNYDYGPLPDSGIYDLKCRLVSTQNTVTFNNTLSPNFEDIVFSQDNSLLVSAYYNFQNDCDLGSLSCSYQVSFDIDDCKSTYTTEKIEDKVQLNSFFESPGSCNGLISSTYMDDEKIFTILKIDEVKTDALNYASTNTCYSCFIEENTVYLETTDYCFNTKSDASDKCYLQNHKVVVNFVCEYNETLKKYDISYDCDLKYSEELFKNGTYDNATKTFTDANGKEYDVDEYGFIRDKETGEKTGYHMEGNAEDGYTVNKTSDIEDLARSLDETEDEALKEVADALKDCTKRDEAGECIEEENSITGAIVDNFISFYTQVRDVYGLTNFIAELKVYKASNANFSIVLDFEESYGVVYEFSDEFMDELIPSDIIYFFRNFLSYMVYIFVLISFLRR